MDGDTLANPDDQVWSFWVEYTLLVPMTYSLIEKQTTSQQGDSVFLNILKDFPGKKDDVNTQGNYEDDTNDVNHKPDHDNQEMIVGQPENGNGGIVFFPPGEGGATGTPVVWTPGTGTTWTRTDPLTYPDTVDSWTPSEGERQLLEEELKDIMHVDGNDVAGRLMRHFDPETINRVVRVELTHPGRTKDGNGNDIEVIVPTTSPTVISPVSLANDYTPYNDNVDEIVICTTSGVYLMRSKREDPAAPGVYDASAPVTWDDPVLFSDSDDDVRDVLVSDFDGDGVRDFIVATGPDSPNRVYLASTGDPLMKRVGQQRHVDGDNSSPFHGGLRHLDFENGANTELKMDTTSVVGIDIDNDGIDDVVIFGTRKAADVVYCCMDTTQKLDIQRDASVAGGNYDTESVTAAMLRVPADLTSPAGDESTKMTVVFGTSNGADETDGAEDVYMQIILYDGTTNVRTPRVTTLNDLSALGALTQLKLPGSPTGTDVATITHTVKFVPMGNDFPQGTSTLTGGVSNHLYIGFHNERLGLSTANKKLLGHYYGPLTDAAFATATPTNIRHSAATSNRMGVGLRGLDVGFVDVSRGAEIPVVYMLSNGGTIFEIVPILDILTTKFVYDYDSNAGVKYGLMKTDGSAQDLTSATVADSDDDSLMRESEASGGVVVTADFDGDTFKDVLSGRHIVLNKGASTTKYSTNQDQRGVFDALPEEYWRYGPTPRDVTAIDVDDDGDVDLVVIPTGGTNAMANSPAATTPWLQVLINDGSGLFARAERRVIVDASGAPYDASDMRIIASGHLNAGTDRRGDFVVGTTTGYLIFKSLGSNPDGTDLHKYAVENFHGLTTVGVGTEQTRDIVITSLTGNAAGSKTRMPQDDIIVVLADGTVHVIPGNAASTFSIYDLSAVGDSTVRKAAVGFLLHDAPHGSATGFVLDAATETTPIRKDGTTATPGSADTGGSTAIRDLDGDGNYLQKPILGQKDNAERYRDVTQKELRTPDIALISDVAVYLIPCVSGVRDVQTRFPGSNAVSTAVGTSTESTAGIQVLYEYPASPARTATGIHLEDMDGNGLYDLVLSFSTTTIYRSVLYTQNGYGESSTGTKGTFAELQSQCASDPRLAKCSSYLGPAKVYDLQDYTETEVAASTAASPDNAGTIKMIVDDMDNDGLPDIIYATEFDETARVSLARPGTPAAGTTSGITTTDLNDEKVLPDSVRTELANIKANMLNFLDAMLASADLTPTIIDSPAITTPLYTGEDRQGIVHRSSNQQYSNQVVQVSSGTLNRNAPSNQCVPKCDLTCALTGQDETGRRPRRSERRLYSGPQLGAKDGGDRVAGRSGWHLPAAHGGRRALAAALPRTRGEGGADFCVGASGLCKKQRLKPRA